MGRPPRKAVKRPAVIDLQSDDDFEPIPVPASRRSGGRTHGSARGRGARVSAGVRKRKKDTNDGDEDDDRTGNGEASTEPEPTEESPEKRRKLGADAVIEDFTKESPGQSDAGLSPSPLNNKSTIGGAMANDSESDDDIVWEVVGGDHDMEVDAAPASQDNAASATVDYTLTTPGVEIKLDFMTKKQKERQRLEREETLRVLGRQRREAFLAIHKAHLVCLVAASLSINRALKDKTVRAVIVSRLPAEAAHESDDRVEVDEIVHSVVDAMRAALRIDSSAVLGDYRAGDASDPSPSPQQHAAPPSIKGKEREIPVNAASSAESHASLEDHPLVQTLCRDFVTGTTSSERFVYACVAASRELGLHTRLVMSPRVAPLRPPVAVRGGNGGDDGDETAFDDIIAGLSSDDGEGEGVRGKKSPNGTLITEREQRDGKTKTKRRSSKAAIVDNNEGGGGGAWASVWMEVLVDHDGHKRWVPVSLPDGDLDNVSACIATATKPVSHVIAVDNDGCVRDVTRRYIPEPSRVRKYRLIDGGVTGKKDDPFSDCAWWRSTLGPLRPKDDELAENEDALLDVSQMTRSLPTALVDYKGHPLYALERHLLKFQAIHPRDVVLGHCRGEPVYPRSNVRDLHTRDAWLKNARVVRDGEMPYKVVKGRQRPSQEGDGDPSAATPKESLLFGEWQTEVYVAAPVVDGIVPKNMHGSVELFRPSMLPRGAVHMRQANIAGLAKRLGIDFAPALVGFEFHAMRSTPLHDGIVVAAENRQLLEDAWREEERERAVRQKAKREASALARWAKLTRSLLTRARLLNKFGSSASTGHEHVFDEGSLRQVEGTGRWTQTCTCGHVRDVDGPASRDGAGVKFSPDEL